ncbi:hypothetical protein L1049_025353 [Liquidambar formosana]|uniref:Uncharacterized protein n=1 Tax=Liquidambar formosana TaxID=63359 RepID=A0AAP0N7U9_LIQFO
MYLRKTCASNKGYILMKHGYGCDLSLHHDETLVGHTRLEPPFNGSFGGFRVEGYYNGLLCISCFGTQHPIHLWNPSIQKFKALPDPNILPPCRPFESAMFGIVPQIND